MSLIDHMMEEFIIMEKTRTPDGAGGFYVSWVDSVPIMAAVVRNNTMEARIAEKESVASVYTITTKRNVILDFHDVIKRSSDGAIFRVTSDSNDIVSPRVSTIDIRQVNAEKWELSK